jgi:hypoxanthine phosphoribosyltransferase
MPEKKIYTWNWVDTQLNNIGEQLEGSSKPEFVTGIPRGGLIPAVLLSHRFDIPFIGLEAAKTLPGNLKKKILVIDDISDTGNTLQQIHRHNFITAALAMRRSSTYTPLYVGEYIKDDHWLVFPWENITSKTIQDYLVK